VKLTIIHPAVGKIASRKYIRAWQMEPLPAAHLAGLTPKDVEINFYDDRMEEIDYDCTTDLVAISVETYTALRSYQIASEFRRRGVTVVMGGFHPTLMPEEVLEYADSIVIGEAEDVWPTLLSDFISGRMQRIYKGVKRPDISGTMPDRSIFGHKNYLKLNLVEASRGCTFNCDFCVIQKYFNSTQTSRGIESVIEEIKRLKNKDRLIFFVDDNTVSRPDEAKALYEALIPLKIRWVSQATITLARDKELMKLLVRSGCQGVLIGFESLNPENLKNMNKQFNNARGGIRKAVKTIHSHGIRLYGTFIFGYDNDTESSFQETLDFCKDEKLFMVAFNHLTPFPATPLYERLKKEGRLIFDSWWLDERYRYGMIPFETKMDPILIEKAAIKARRAFYSYSSIIKRASNWTNISNLKMIMPYFFINSLLKNDVSIRNGLPLGDETWKGSLLKVENYSKIKTETNKFLANE
jgi:radical SAM superfamily enzyme YgiQ (UPF0313 family)